MQMSNSNSDTGSQILTVTDHDTVVLVGRGGELDCEQNEALVGWVTKCRLSHEAPHDPSDSGWGASWLVRFVSKCCWDPSTLVFPRKSTRKASHSILSWSPNTIEIIHFLLDCANVIECRDYLFFKQQQQQQQQRGNFLWRSVLLKLQSNTFFQGIVFLAARIFYIETNQQRKKESNGMAKKKLRNRMLN
jgi:hypothetical protein